MHSSVPFRFRNCLLLLIFLLRGVFSNLKQRFIHSFSLSLRETVKLQYLFFILGNLNINLLIKYIKMKVNLFYSPVGQLNQRIAATSQFILDSRSSTPNLKGIR